MSRKQFLTWAGIVCLFFAFATFTVYQRVKDITPERDDLVFCDEASCWVYRIHCGKECLVIQTIRHETPLTPSSDLSTYKVVWVQGDYVREPFIYDGEFWRFPLENCLKATQSTDVICCPKDTIPQQVLTRRSPPHYEDSKLTCEAPSS